MKCWTNSPSKTFTDYSWRSSQCNVGSTHVVCAALHQLLRIRSQHSGFRYARDNACHVFKVKFNPFWLNWGGFFFLSDCIADNVTNRPHPNTLIEMYLIAQRPTEALSKGAELCLKVWMYFSSVSLTRGSTTAACFGFMHKHELAFQLSPHITNLNLNEPPLQIHQQAMTLHPPHPTPTQPPTLPYYPQRHIYTSRQ